MISLVSGPVAPTSRCPNANVGILDGQQWNVIIVAVIKLVPPRNAVEMLLDEVAQPPQVGVLPLAVRGRWATANLEQCHGFGVAGLQRYFSIAKKYLAPESSAAVRTMCGSRTGGWSLPCVMSD
jgi:hypothetical protein